MPQVYDTESFPNFWSMCIKPVGKPGFFFEISDRRRDNGPLWNYVAQCDQMIGFNNFGYDWPVVQHFMENPQIDAAGLYAKSMEIINSGDRFAHTIWNPAVPQVDLFLIHHFNNRAKSTSLKKLQFNMRSRNVMDSPIPFGTHLNYAEMDSILGYNAHDVTETEAFYLKSLDKIKLREAINPDWINQSDTGLGRKYFERELQARGVVTHERDADGRRKPLGTPRPNGVRLSDVIFPYIGFQRPELAHALDTFRRVWVPTQDFAGDDLPTEAGALHGKVFGLLGDALWRNHEFNLDGIDVTCGLGGIHGSRERKLIIADQHHEIVDLDVTSFYPNIAIKNRIYPLHLGPGFCDVYAALLARRLGYAKGSPEYAAIKLALNSVFGSAGSAFTCFYDPAWMLAITINGQLLILKLAEMLLAVPGVRLVQLNTDGITVMVPREHRAQLDAAARAWSAGCLMPLETADYSRMWIRDVNNYLAEYPPAPGANDSKVKRKGAYNAERDWHQNHGMPIVRRAAEAHMVRGESIAEHIAQRASEPAGGWDFMMRLDLTKASKLVLDDGTEHRGVTRYYVSPSGNSAVKHMPATTTRIHGRGHADVVGKRGSWCCTACWQFFKTKKEWEAHADTAHSSKLRLAQVYDGEPIDYDMRYYAGEAEKLVISDRFYP